MSKILRSVGRGGVNLISDVTLVQTLLNKQNFNGVTKPLKLDGKAGTLTISRIELFQRKVMGMGKPDGRVDPDGKTMAKLLTAAQGTAGGAKPSNNFQLSGKGLIFLKSIEMLRLKPYDDQTGKDITSWLKGATIGYGHLISNGEWEKYKKGITDATENSLFTSDLSPYIRTVSTKVTAQLTQNQFDALVIFVYNIGIDAFTTSSVLKLVNDPTVKTGQKYLESAWKAWNKSQGQINTGLVNRRNAEWKIYSINIYQRW